MAPSANARVRPSAEGHDSPLGHGLLPPVVGVCVGEAGGGVCVVQRAAHHDGAREGVVVVPWGVSAKTLKLSRADMCTCVCACA